MKTRMIQIGDEIVSENKLFDWCVRHIDGTREITELHMDPEPVKTAAPRRPPARFSPEVIDFE